MNMLLLTILVIIAAVVLILEILRLKSARTTAAGSADLEGRLGALEKGLDRLERVVGDEAYKGRSEAAANAQAGREELAKSLKSSSDSTLARMAEIAGLVDKQLGAFTQQLHALTQANEQRLDKMRETVETRLKTLQDDNSQKLELMRATVDEKLHATLEKRLGDSFNLVSERLEKVHQGLGEMQSLAAGVGDLKKVLTNVKTRGTWGEIQLGNLLEQILTREQYAANVCTKKGSSERVEFALRMPGRGDCLDGEIWLPIDAKFPQESYQKLIEAQEQANPDLAEAACRELEARIKSEARDIREKYIDPPNTTDFGLMFLPIEGLYAEVLRRPGLCEQLQREYRVVVTGPTTLTALLNSLQMGFRTLAIEKRSSEVWALLGAIKTEFCKFGDLLDKTQKKLTEAGNTIEDAARKSRTIERKLKDVQSLPAADAQSVIGEIEDAPYKEVEGSDGIN